MRRYRVFLLAAFALCAVTGLQDVFFAVSSSAIRISLHVLHGIALLGVLAAIYNALKRRTRIRLSAYKCPFCNTPVAVFRDADYTYLAHGGKPCMTFVETDPAEFFDTLHTVANPRVTYPS